MILIAITMLFSCQDNYKQKQQLTIADLGPIAQGEGINLKYTDSGRMVANLITPQLLDFSNYNYAFTEFPKGLTVYFWDENNKKGSVVADYGLHFEQANLIDLRGNVVLITADSLKLQAQQLYWDQNNQWVFTDQPYRILFKDGSQNDGSRFDAREDFSTFISRKNISIQIIDNLETNNNDEQKNL